MRERGLRSQQTPPCRRGSVFSRVESSLQGPPIRGRMVRGIPRRGPFERPFGCRSPESEVRGCPRVPEGVEYVRGHAAFVSSHEVKVGKDRHEGDKFVIGTGSSPTIPPVPGIDKVEYLTNVEALSLKERPDSMIVVGGRALGLEFAQMYQHLGTQVTVLQRSPRIVPEEEPEISQYLEQYLKEDGVEIHVGAEVLSAEQRKSRKVVVVRVGARKRTIEADELLLATGRTPNTAGLNLQAARVDVKEDQGVKVDSEMRSTAPHIFAAGDVIGKPMLETTAAKEGYIAAENALANRGLKMDYRAVPHAVFTSPAVASVGPTD